MKAITIAGVAADKFEFQSATATTIKDVTISALWLDGIQTRAGTVIGDSGTSNKIQFTGTISGTGIDVAAGGAAIKNVTIASNAGTGIKAAANATIGDSTKVTKDDISISNNTGNGIIANASTDIYNVTIDKVESGKYGIQTTRSRIYEYRDYVNNAGTGIDITGGKGTTVTTFSVGGTNSGTGIKVGTAAAEDTGSTTLNGVSINTNTSGTTGINVNSNTTLNGTNTITNTASGAVGISVNAGTLTIDGEGITNNERQPAEDCHGCCVGCYRWNYDSYQPCGLWRNGSPD